MKHIGRFLLYIAVGLSLYNCSRPAENAAGAEDWHLESEEMIDCCAADFDIKYSLYVKGGDVFAGYYDKDHRLKVAKRDSSGRWDYVVLNETVNWDSHNYISLVVDRNGTVHLCGNMHKDPLVYYRSELPGNIATLRKDTMTNILEDSVTYPEFLQTEEMLVFHYRNGRSGNGDTYFNTYDFKTRHWEKLQTEPLFDGMNESNSYFKGPVWDDDGKFHLLWCWRDEPHCETNHGLYYAFSDDLKEWTTPGGFSKTAPLTPRDSGFLVDDIKVKEGLINGGFALGFDDNRHPVIGYHKYDENDHTNLFSATFGDNRWTIRRITDWNWKWEFSGRGSIPFELVIDKVWQRGANQYFYISRAVDTGFFGGRQMKNYLIDYKETDGTVVETEYYDTPGALRREQRPDVAVHEERDRGETWANDSVKYLLVYETPYPNRDKKRKKNLPPSPLRLVKIKR